MFGNHYYHARIRKAVASFGRIFNDIYIIRKKSDGTVLQTMKVPIAYAPRSKYLERMCRSNDQILKLAELIAKEEEKSEAVSEDDIFSRINQ